MIGMELSLRGGIGNADARNEYVEVVIVEGSILAKSESNSEKEATEGE